MAASTQPRTEPRTGVQAFSQDIEHAFQTYLERESKNRSLFTAADRSQYRMCLEEPDLKPQLLFPDKADQQRFRNQKHDAITNYELDPQSQLYRTPKTAEERPRVVACTYDSFKHIVHAHHSVAHAGISLTYKELVRTVYGIAREDVKWLLKHCRVCLVNRKSITRAPLQPIVAEGVLERVQADLIDMRHQPDGHNKWILHIKDHFSKFSMLYALHSKRAIEIADAFSLFVRHFDIPDILQTDNGREFKGALLIFLKQHGIKLINGRPRSPQAQGLVEQSNGVVKDKIRKWQEENGSPEWAIALTEEQKHKVPEEEIIGLRTITDDQIDAACREDVNPSQAIENTGITVDQFCTELIPREKHIVESDSDPDNPLDFGSRASPPSVIDDDPHSADEEPGPSNLEAENRVEAFPCVDPRLLILNKQEERASLVREHQQGVRTRMSKKYDSKHMITTFKLDDLVTLAVPREDRAATDSLRLIY
ncbi:Ribonuclease H-like domain [Lasallia pustulata]|uniref:Ribonuclease H-like domain n=1 Tax=Lasallia pustulata TaxID=136370 RepID=A0A1W5DE46_9LECA|nr:Ribonuclease H-like domain [Lasallia pustulata]